MFTLLTGIAIGYGTAYVANRFGPALKVWKAKREKEIEEQLRNQ